MENEAAQDIQDIQDSEPIQDSQPIQIVELDTMQAGGAVNTEGQQIFWDR